MKGGYGQDFWGKREEKTSIPLSHFPLS